MEIPMLTALSIYLAVSHLAPSIAFQQPRHIIKTLSSHPRAQPNDDDDPSQDNNPLQQPSLPKTQSQSARRAELQRRLSRIQSGFATPGISSAIPGAQNYAIEPSLTEREYFASLGLDASSIHAGLAAATAGELYAQVSEREIQRMDELEKEKQIALHTTLGLTHLRSLRLKAAYSSFEYVYKLNEEAYLWQFGLLQYYFGEYEAGRRTCAENARRYESKFGHLGEVASEERIWRDACLLKEREGVGKKKRKKKNVADEDGDGNEEEEKRLEMENISCERRKAIRLARQLFSASVHNNPTKVAMTRVQLQSMCQDDDDDENKSVLQKKLIDPKMYKLHSYFYLGLHYDALGQIEESKQCMKMALKSCANGIGGNNQDITYLLPVIHMTVRDWYDDDEFDNDVQEQELEYEQDAGEMKDEDELIQQLMQDGALDLTTSGIGSNGVSSTKKKEKDRVSQGIRESIKHMRIVDLRQELKKRRLKVAGSKKELQDRLVNDIALEMEKGK